MRVEDIEEIDTSKPHSARVYDYFLGGKTNFAADRKAAEAIHQINPYTAFACQTARAWMHRATEYVVRKGCTQILDIGTGIPTPPNVHEVAQEVNRRTRVVYVDSDPIVLHYARQLLMSSEEGATAYVQADFLDGARLFELPQVQAVLDLKQPVALSLNNLLHFVPGEPAYETVQALMDRLAAGSYLIISHITQDYSDVMNKVMETYSRSVIPAQARTHRQMERFFDGLQLVEPGIVPPPLWQASPEDVIPPLDHVNAYVGVGMKTG